MDRHTRQINHAWKPRRGDPKPKIVLKESNKIDIEENCVFSFDDCFGPSDVLDMLSSPARPLIQRFIKMPSSSNRRAQELIVIIQLLVPARGIYIKKASINQSARAPANLSACELHLLFPSPLSSGILKKQFPVKEYILIVLSPHSMFSCV